ncbi:hypothetical protein [Legionella sp. PC997]|uniref:hypothetical protein n=1 Tax=Legionella sp. PC997 TaxID=2755562 RepID=UPI0015F80B80|nr:hypothetical protein [Legionella sp. PC997]QMT59373.1 hypothetical protein HBNCFIEN_00739 [Legionella sp. PC997]
MQTKLFLSNTPRYDSTLHPQHLTADGAYIKINDLSLYDTIKIRDYKITVNAFLKRNYVFEGSDNKSFINRHSLRNAFLFPDGTITVGGKPIIQHSDRASHKRPLDYADNPTVLQLRELKVFQYFRIGTENPIRKESFLKRQYLFKSNKEVVPKNDLRNATIYADGTVTVFGKEIFWQRRSTFQKMDSDTQNPSAKRRKIGQTSGETDSTMPTNEGFNNRSETDPQCSSSDYIRLSDFTMHNYNYKGNVVSIEDKQAVIKSGAITVIDGELVIPRFNLEQILAHNPQKVSQESLAQTTSSKFGFFSQYSLTKKKPVEEEQNQADTATVQESENPAAVSSYIPLSPGFLSTVGYLAKDLSQEEEILKQYSMEI